MIRIRFAALLALVLLSAPLALAEHHETAEATLSDAERTHLLESLEKAGRSLEALAKEAGDAHWAAKPADEGWSVGEVVEHIVIAEESLFGMVQAALESDPDPAWQELSGMTVDQLMAGLQDRSQQIQAPEEVVPTGTWTRDQALERFHAIRAKTADFVSTTELPVKMHMAEGPPGKMSVHHWLTLIAGHNLRHNAQMREVLDEITGKAPGSR